MKRKIFAKAAPANRAARIQQIPARELSDWPVHPLADRFPMIDHDELERLGASLAKKQEHPVIACKGVIIDGRNRIAAGRMHNLSLMVEARDTMTEDEIERVIMSLNVARRSIKKSTLIAIANDYYMGAQETGRDLSLAATAQLFGVSKRSLCRYREQLLNPLLPRQRQAAAAHPRVPPRMQVVVRAIADLKKLDRRDRRPRAYNRYFVAFQNLAMEIMSEPEMQEAWERDFANRDQADS